MRALERAIAFCQSTLSYGRVQEPPPDRKPIGVEALVEEVHETLASRAEIADRAGSPRSSAASWSMPTPTSFSASCSISRATPCRRWRRARRTIRRATRSASPAGARAPWW